MPAYLTGRYEEHFWRFGIEAGEAAVTLAKARRPSKFSSRREMSHKIKIIVLTAVFMLSASTVVFAQPKATDQPPADNPSGSVAQPQGETGPIVTKSGGAPASSPQGESPGGMQSAPKGATEVIKTDNGGVPEGTPKN